MNLKEFWSSVPEAASWNHAEKIKLFAWFLHSYNGKDAFSGSDINSCFNQLSLNPPSSVGPFLDSFARRKPRQMLRDRNGFRLEARIKDDFDQKFGQRESTILVLKLLGDLPAKMPTAADKAYLQEALICFKHGAFRGAIVMAWNLAYDHLCVWVFHKHLSAFNARLPIRYPKANLPPIINRDDFTEIKESQVIEVCNSGGIITGSVFKVLDEKLKRRNLAAHPSGISISQLTAEEFIKDVVENVVLKLV